MKISKLFIIVSLSLMIFSCQKKQYTFFQVASIESITRQEQIKTELERPVLTKKKAKPAGIISTKPLIPQKMDTLSNKKAKASSLANNEAKKGIRNNFFLISKYLKPIIQDTLIKEATTSKKADEIHKHKGRTAGILGLLSLGLVLLGIIGAYVSAFFGVVLIASAFITSLTGLIMGWKANRYLMGKASSMASIGVLVGVLFLIGFIGLIILATQFSLSD
jgi:ABC-type multidrug transport system permease subunit